MRDSEAPPDLDTLDPFERQAAERRLRARQYAPRLRPDQFFSHESAVALLGGPLPLVTEKGRPVDGMMLPVHVCTDGAGTLVRAKGVTSHRGNAADTTFDSVAGARIARPETVWAQLGSWDLLDLVALGDHFCRAWRNGHGRPDPGRRPMSTVDRLQTAIASGRRVGIQRLRDAVELVREDSWSPRESKIRCHLVLAGVPEPRLNHDVYDDDGGFLACVDLAYPEKKVAIEYQSMLHHSRYSADVERIAALRAAGWNVIEVSAELFTRPEEFVARVRRALAT
ncbi:hypothetical protein [Microbacterium sp. NPDC087589]|uniref:hypothetical protein n=1 Tax=Microbacterium sp. NPDC087589 TaxID=3364191 RepID=UPI003810BA39